MAVKMDCVCVWLFVVRCIYRKTRIGLRRDCVKNDMETLGLYQNDAQFIKNGGELRGQPANAISPENGRLNV